MDDPRRPIVEVMARLGRETQLHLDERHRHFKVTDKVIFGISIFLLIVAMFNVYYVWVLSKDLDGIVSNMESMHDQLVKVDDEMTVIAESIERYDDHVAYMNTITNNVGSMTDAMPHVRVNMDHMTEYMQVIEKDMVGMNHAMEHISEQMHHMKNGMSFMRSNVREFSRPIGAMNPVLP